MYKKKKYYIYYMNPFSTGVKNRGIFFDNLEESGKKTFKTTKKRRDMFRKTIQNSLEYNNNNNQNEFVNDNVRETKEGIKSLLNYFSEYKREQLQTRNDLKLQDYYINLLIDKFDELIKVFESNTSKSFINVKKKIIKNLNEILIPKIEQLNREIDRNIRQKEEFESIISSINYKSNIPPMTMSNHLRTNSPSSKTRANSIKKNINEWPVLSIMDKNHLSRKNGERWYNQKRQTWMATV
jgi:hypothetical protein